MSTLDHQRVSASARKVFEALHEDIALGRFNPRERPIEADFARQYSTHRHTVREALNLLTQTGFIVHPPNNEVSVAEMTLKELRSVYDLRIEMECLAARWMPLSFPPAALNALRDIQDQHSTAIAKRDFQAIFRADLEFHSHIAERCGNHHLAEMTEMMSNRGILARYSVGMDEDYLQSVEEDHLRIIAALKDEGRDALVEATRAQFMRGSDWYAKLLALFAK